MMNWPNTMVHAVKTSVLDLWKEDPLFEVCWAVWLTVRVLLATAIFMDTSTSLLRVAIACSLLPLAIRELFLFRSYELADWIWLACVAALVPSALVSDDTLLVQSMALAFVARRNDYQSLLRFTGVLLAMGAGAVALLSIVGVIPTVSHPDIRGPIRESFGFAYPSRLPNILLTLVLSMQCNAGRRRASLPAVLVATISIVVYWAARSRGPFVFTILAILVWTAGSMLPDLSTKARRIVGALSASSFAACAAAMTYLCAMYSKKVPWMKVINDITSNRLVYSHNAFRHANPSLFGTNLFTGNADYAVGYLDSSYLKLLLSSGIIAFVIVMALFMRCTYVAAMKGNVGLTGALVVVALHATMEWQLTSIMYTPMMFCLFMGADALSGRPYQTVWPYPKHLVGTGRALHDE